MNAHITTRTVSAATIARPAVLALALIVSALVNWWFNNSFTKEAIQADAEFERLRKSVK